MPASVNDVPTSSTNGVPRKHPGQDRGEHAPTVKTDFMCRVKYSNTLPDIPFEAKFLACPFTSLSRQVLFIEYKQTMLEKKFKFELLAESDLGVKIDLINPETYFVDMDTPKKQQLHPTDAELLEDEHANPQNSRRSLQHSKMVPWMRKTEYISSEFTRFGVSNERQETKVGYSIKKKFQNEVIYRDRASQIAAINKTGMMDEEGEQFVTYFLPTKETLDKRMLDTKDGKEFDPDYTYEYYSVRDYNWLVRNKSTKGYEQDNFLFSFRDTGVYYNELETRVSLTRRKAKRSRQQTKLMVRNRAYDENELATQEDREHHLLRPYDEKDDDDDDEDDDEASEKESSEENEGEPNEDGEKRKKDSDASDNDEKKSEEGSTDNEEKVKESGTDEEESGTDDEKNSEKSDSSEND
ncbi:RNA polymerase II-associated factor 1 -like protein [Toxocara canis]|uniref:RNA polymerase II-associated factor 1 homolog n=1 Tax=Toxocara canis TaxID=6265 RepID=A0A0B2VFL8_TOXCA|nr:RNA polymerase II-associated factor 1 -like protein [Toxocara canis]